MDQLFTTHKLMSPILEDQPRREIPEDLAIFGTAPAFTEKLHVGRPNIGDRRFLDLSIEDIFDRRWLSNHGPYVQEFERAVAEIVGVKHCIAMCNGTVALEIAIRALELKGEVIIPSLTFIATAHALKWQEITPVFCDIDPDTKTIDPKQIRKHITPNTSGIIGVHLWSKPCDIQEIEALAAEHDLQLIFDAAHAFGCSYNGKMIGSFGDLEVFSFHPTKFINALEGGAVVTNNDELAKKIRLMKNFGFSDLDKVTYIGTNGKMNEVSAATGLSSLKCMESFILANYRNYKKYQQIINGIPGIELIGYNEKEKCNYQYIVTVVDEDTFGISRDRLVEILVAENIFARRYFYPGCHRMEPYSSLFPNAGLMLPITEELLEKVILLPTGTAIETNEVDLIGKIIATAVVDSGKTNLLLDKLDKPGFDTQIPYNEESQVVMENQSSFLSNQTNNTDLSLVPQQQEPQVSNTSIQSNLTSEQFADINRKSVPPFLINNLPKAGTHLIKSIVEMFPGIQCTGLEFLNHLADELNISSNGDNTTVPLGVDWPKFAPVTGVKAVLNKIGHGQFAIAHTCYSEGFDILIRDLGIRTLLILRDPRDVVISHAKFIAKKENHFLYPIYEQISPEERIIASIVGFEQMNPDELMLLNIDHRYRSLLPWNEKSYNYTTRFEKLVGENGKVDKAQQTGEILSITRHLGIKFDKSQLSQITDSISIGASNFEKEQNDGWKDHFTPLIKTAFKETAGKLLVELGYEENLDW